MHTRGFWGGNDGAQYYVYVLQNQPIVSALELGDSDLRVLTRLMHHLGA